MGDSDKQEQSRGVVFGVARLATSPVVSAVRSTRTAVTGFWRFGESLFGAKPWQAIEVAVDTGEELFSEGVGAARDLYANGREVIRSATDGR